MKWRYRILIAGAVLGTAVVVGAAFALPPVVVWEAGRVLNNAGFPEAGVDGLHIGPGGATISRFDLSPRVHASAVTIAWHLGGLLSGHLDRVSIGEVLINAQWAQGSLDIGRHQTGAAAPANGAAGGGGAEAAAHLPFDHLTIAHAAVAVSGDGWKVETTGQASADATSDGRLAVALDCALAGAAIHADGTVDPAHATGDGAFHAAGDIAELAQWLPTVVAAVMPGAGIAMANPGAVRVAGTTVSAAHGTCSIDGELRLGADRGGVDATFTAQELGASLPVPGLPRAFAAAGEVDAGVASLAGACDASWGLDAQNPRVDVQARGASLSSPIFGIRAAFPHLHVNLAGGSLHGDGRAEVLGAFADAAGERAGDGSWRANALFGGIDLAAWQARVRPWLAVPMTLSGVATLGVSAQGGTDGAVAATGDVGVSGLAIEAPFGAAVLKFSTPSVTGHGVIRRGSDGGVSGLVVPGFSNGRLDIPVYQLQIGDLSATVPVAVGENPGISGTWRAAPFTCLGHSLGAAHGTVAVVGRGITADAVTAFAGLALRGSIAIPGDGAIHATAVVDPGVLTDLTAFGPYVPQLDGWTGGGRISAAAAADFVPGSAASAGWHQHVDVIISGAHVERADQHLTITGINCTAALTGLTPLSANISTLHVAHVAVGPQTFDHIIGAATLAYPDVDLANFSWAWGDGRFTAAAMHADLTAQIAQGSVAVDHLDIARVVSLFANGRVNATGRLAGDQGMRIHWNPLRVQLMGGTLHAEGGEVKISDPALLAQIAEPVVANLSHSADNLGPAAESMRSQVRKKVYDGFADFVYTALTTTITDHDAGGRTTITIAGQGENGLPIRSLTLNITGLEDGINSALVLQQQAPTAAAAPQPTPDDMNAFFGP